MTNDELQALDRLIGWVVRAESAQGVTMRSIEAQRRWIGLDGIKMIRAATIARLREIRHSRIVVAGEVRR